MNTTTAYATATRTAHDYETESDIFRATTSNLSTTATTSVPGYLTAVQIACCLCGTMIYPNAANQCSSCLAQDFNLQSRLQRGPNNAPHPTIYQCRDCRRFMRTEKHYEHAEPESPNLLALCLKQIPALNQSTNGRTKKSHSSSKNANSSNYTSSDAVETKMAPLHLVDANWIWTEPHCRRLKLHITVRTELSNVPVQQRCMVELFVAWKQCPDCNKEYTSRTWHALVQLRQKEVSDPKQQTKKGLTTIELALGRAKPSVRQHILKLDHVKSGFDFYFMTLAHAQHFTSFLQTIVPMKIRTSHKLVSTDSKNNSAHIKHTITADIVPLLKNDLIFVQKSTPKNSLAGTLAIVMSVKSGTIRLLEAVPSTAATLRMMKKINNNNNSNTIQLHPKHSRKNNTKKEKHKQQNREDQQHFYTDISPSQSNSGLDIDSAVQVNLSAEAYYKYEKNYIIIQSSNVLTRFVVLDVALIKDAANERHQQTQNLSCDQNQFGIAENENEGDDSSSDDSNLSDHSVSKTSNTNVVCSKPKQKMVQLHEQQLDGTNDERCTKKGYSRFLSQSAWAAVEVARETDMGVKSETFHVWSHLGRLLQPGDIVLGYDLTISTNHLPGRDATTKVENGGDGRGTMYETRNNFVLPDIILVKKVSSSLSKNLEKFVRISQSDDNIQTTDSTLIDHNYTVKSDLDKNLAIVDKSDDDSDDDGDNQSQLTESNMTNNKIFNTISDNNNMGDTRSIAEKSTITTAIRRDLDGKPILSKSKQRRRLRREGKRRLQLEQSAIRMGLIPSSQTSNLAVKENSSEENDDSGEDSDN